MTSTSIPVHGNYHGYYSKRPFVNDERLALLPPDFFENTSCLDVGCNEGWVTCEIAQSWGARKVVGVDIDETLIRAAWRRRLTVWSLQGPPFSTSEVDVSDLGSSDNSCKRKRDCEEPARLSDIRPDYFPMSCEHSFGPFPIPLSDKRPKDVYPRNVSFRTADWVTEEIPEDTEGYDIVVALSITKWIHLNGGDDAIKTFFRRVYSTLRPGGKLVLEPQAWNTYKKARRMHPKLRDNAQHLALRPEEFGAILKDIGFGSAENLGTPGDGGFHRPVDVYIKV